MKINIVVCYHKRSSVISTDVYIPIHVGKERSELSLPMKGDDTGENISRLNGLYCELTGMYWAWKNLDADYLGLCHYRRLFSFTTIQIKMRDIPRRLNYLILKILYSLFRACGNFIYYRYSQTISSQDVFDNLAIQFSQQLQKYIDTHPETKIFALHRASMGNLTNWYSTAITGGRIHMPILDEIVKHDYPNIYPFMQKTLKSNKLYYANMIIMKKDALDEYCSFVFGVLDEHLRRCLNEGIYRDIEEKSIARLSGYLGELLTSSFISYYSKVHPGALKKLSMLKYE